METAQWYFDVISPFAYLHLHALAPLRDRVVIEPVPVLFAGMLKHWDNKGPAEVPPKREHTYRYCVWAAHRAGLPLRMPARHPFNSLAAQRLLVSLDASDAAIEAAFRFVWSEGHDPEFEIAALGERLGVADVTASIGNPDVKRRLMSNTQRAIEAGAFGVPTLVFRQQVFWGSDTVDWVTQYLTEPELFQHPDYLTASASAFGIART